MRNKKILTLFPGPLAGQLCAPPFVLHAFVKGCKGDHYFTETDGTEADPGDEDMEDSENEE